ncbi:MAG: glycosyltransferase, partial [Sedimentisphaerales bacterium]
SNMKILVVTPSMHGKGGVTSLYATLRDYYSADVEYFTIGRRKPDEGKIAQLYRLVKDSLLFCQNLKRGYFSLVHLNPSLRKKAVIRDGLLLYLAKRAGKNVVVFFHGWDKEYESRLHSWKLKLFKRIYLNADAIIVLAEEFKARLRAWGYTGPIYLGTTTFDDNCMDSFNIESKLKAQNQSINLLFLSWIVKEKGIYEALRAYHLVKSRGRDIRFIVAGDGHELSEVKKYVMDKQIQGVDFRGFVSGQDKFKVLKEGDVYVFPSYSEGMPNSVLEAMAFGLPVITRSVGGLRDFFEDGKMGFITASKDPHVLADYIEKLIMDEELRKSMSRYNHEYAVKHFPASKVTRRIERIYQDVLERKEEVRRPVIHLILSLDYEIFGSAAGDVMRDIIKPTNRLLDICDKYGAKMTIMFEVAEYWAFKKAEQDGKLKLDYSPAAEMEKQAQDAVRRGHDVQLHLHPQWIGAELKDGLWHLNFDWCRIADLPNGLGYKEDLFSIAGALYQGKKALEDMLKPIRKDYECVVFRAGAFCIQPARNVIEAMKQVGLVADSSVVRGHHKWEPYLVDFRKAQEKAGFWWTDTEDVVRRGGKYKGILELPVYSQMKPAINNLKLLKVKATVKRYILERKDPHSRISSIPTSIPPKSIALRMLFSKYPMKFDFGKLSSADMYRVFVTEINKQIRTSDSSVYPFVGIGHCKDFWNDKNFEKFISSISSNTELRSLFCFDTFGGVLKRIVS